MTDRKFIKLNEDEFEKRFELVRNPFEDTGWNGCFLKPTGSILNISGNAIPLVFGRILRVTKGNLLL